MTREEFRKYIRENIVILDGATGTNLMAAGMPVGVCPPHPRRSHCAEQHSCGAAVTFA